jgi:hypothetical protein
MVPSVIVSITFIDIHIIDNAYNLQAIKLWKQQVNSNGSGSVPDGMKLDSLSLLYKCLLRLSSGLVLLQEYPASSIWRIPDSWMVFSGSHKSLAEQVSSSRGTLPHYNYACRPLCDIRCWL